MGQIIKFLFFFVVLAANKFVTGYEPQKIFLSVYYESRCPDSKKFVLNQLVPAVEMLSEYIMLRLVPFGKARSINHGYGGFECQHGPAECFGNMIHSCTLQLLPVTNEAQVNYLACEMRNYAASNGDLSCVQKAGVSADQITQCITSGRGMLLQLDAEELTDLIQPKFIPTVTVDGIFNQQIQDSAQIDLVGTLCSILKETKKCANHYNNMAMKYILV